MTKEFSPVLHGPVNLVRDKVQADEIVYIPDQSQPSDIGMIVKWCNGALHAEGVLYPDRNGQYWLAKAGSWLRKCKNTWDEGFQFYVYDEIPDIVKIDATAHNFGDRV